MEIDNYGCIYYSATIVVAAARAPPPSKDISTRAVF